MRLVLTLLLSCAVLHAQPAPRDTTGMPRLEIPEITIVGKKAITLPFARKGELYDVTLYEAPPPDTTLLRDRPEIPLPIGSLPRYEEPLVPLHISAEGYAGNFTSLGGRGLVDYAGRGWGMHGEAGFDATKGHVENSSGSSVHAGGSAHMLLGPQLSAAFQATGGLQIAHDSYGMFAFGDTTRKRTDVVISAGLGTVSRSVNALDLRLSADLTSVSDESRSASAVSPDLEASFRTTAGGTDLLAAFSYKSSSLDYKSTTQSPSLARFRAEGRWRMTNGWLVTLGGTYDAGSGSDGEDRTIISPYGEMRLELDKDRTLSIWMRPELSLAGYGEYFAQNPYLVREIAIRPERKPLNAGGTLWYNNGIASLEVRASVAKTTNTAVQIADSGRISLRYVDASKVAVRANATLRFPSGILFNLFGLIQPSYEDGTTTQLPMVPVAQLGARAELSLNSPVTLWSSLEYWSKQNIDLAGTNTIGDHLLLSVGASAQILRNTMLSAEVTNLMNTSYDWWSGYRAPGTGVRVNAKVNLR